MNRRTQSGLTRRQFVRTAFSGLVSFVLAACGLRPPEPTTPPSDPEISPPTEPPAAPTEAAPAAATEAPAPTEAVQALPPTPACGDDDDPTPAQTEGPFYTPSSPERTSLLEAGMAGTPMTLAGFVLSTNCLPVAGALVDFWHADDGGAYDNAGYRLRGHQFTDDQGRYVLETIVPGLYPGRTRHFHVKVQAPGGSVLTTQLYFPDEPGNQTDGIFHPDLVMEVQSAEAGRQGAFNFVVEAA